MLQPHFLAVLLPVLIISGLGLFMMRAHLKTWRSRQNDRASTEDQQESLHLGRQFRRRMQASGMLVLIGVLIAAGQFIDGKKLPRLFTCYWLVVIVLTFWLILLAMGDALSIANYSRVARARLEDHQRELEAELERLKVRQSNGHTQVLDPAAESDDPNESV